MNINTKTYRKDLDVLKGFAILSVVFYHLGILKSGYLGVDLFLVINGFLVIPSVCRHIADGDFSYWEFLKKRVMRLLPLIVIATAVCLLWGFIAMLPDDYENLSQYVIASNVLSGNIMSAISSGNYWAAFNEYKPLMHMWYVGIIFEFYVTFPLVVMLVNRCKRLVVSGVGNLNGGRITDNKIFTNTLLLILLFVSLSLYLIPGVSGHKFYHVQFRYFEFVAGGLMGMNLKRLNYDNAIVSTITNLLLVLTICISLFTFDIHDIGGVQIVIGASNTPRGLLLPNNVLVILTVLLSCLVIAQNNDASPINHFLFKDNTLAFVGKMSFSIFVWHQIVIAFYRYSFSSRITILSLLCYLLFVFVLSWITYYFVEQKIKPSNKAFIITLASDVVVSLIAGLIYLNAGVVRDVPEIDAYVHNAKRGMHIAYCDRIYSYNQDFPKNDKPNVLVIGNSFSRDMANVILESKIKDSINLSYINELKPSYSERIAKADKIFIFGSKKKIPEYLWSNLKEGVEVWGISTKSFGVSNGAIYYNHNKPWYFDQTVSVNETVLEINRDWKQEWGEYFIDMMQLAMVGEDQVRVFSPEHKFISPDCEHLVRGGAQYYASVLDFESIFDDILIFNK